MDAPSGALPAPATRVDGARLLDSLRDLAAIDTGPGGGANRLAFSDEDVRARAHVATLMADAGLAVRTDPAGNLVGERAGLDPGLPMLLLGSHIDTVPDGGSLDGAYGVLAAVEVARTLAEREVPLACGLAVIAFADEEGTRKTPAMWGSHAFVGALTEADLRQRDEDGVPMAELVAAVGGDLARIREAAAPRGSIGAYLELHIEQGPVLEHLGADIGVVEAITGRVSAEVTVHGQTNHAGTTPMELRRDALASAARLITEVERLGRTTVRVATVGACSVEPNAWNVVPGRVRFVADFRDATETAMAKAVTELRRAARAVGEATGTSVEVEVRQVVEPVGCDPRLRRIIAGASDSLGLRRHDMPSGAGHDAQVLGRTVPVGMIFVPSHDGVSHAPAEHTDPAQLVAGADVLLRSVLAYAGELGAPRVLSASGPSGATL